MVGPILFDKLAATSLIEQVQEKIAALLKGGKLPVNKQLPPERDLAAQLGISRTTLREALRGLADRGVLEARQGAGWFVRPRTDAVVQSLALHFRLSDITFEQLAEARQAIEPAIVAAAASRRDDRDLEELDSCLTAMVAAADAREFLQADTRFHEALARASRNVLFDLAIKPILRVLEETRGETVKIPGRRQRVVEEHRRVLTAVRNRDVKAAERAITAHLDSFVEAAGAGSASVEAG